MIKIIIVCIFMLSIESLYGQGFQVGLRTGENNWSRFKKVYNGRDMVQRINWTKEIFARYEIKRFGFEIGVSQYNNSAYFIDSPYIIFDVYPSPDKVQYNFHQNVWDFMTRIQYNIAPRQLVQNGLSSYLGFNVGIQTIRSNNESIEYYSGHAEKISSHSAYSEWLVGLSSNTYIRLSKAIRMNMYFGYDIIPRFVFNSAYNGFNTKQSKLGVSFGIGYSLN